MERFSPYRWRELRLLSNTCLSRQNFCLDNHTSVATKDVFYRDKHVFVATKHNFVATNIFRDSSFVATNIFFRDKLFVTTTILLSRQKMRFVATKMILVAVLANGIFHAYDEMEARLFD